MNELDLVYEDTGNHLELDDICNFTTFRTYHDKLNLKKHHLKDISCVADASGESEFDICIMTGRVRDILDAFDEIGQTDFYSEEPVAMFFEGDIKAMN